MIDVFRDGGRAVVAALALMAGLLVPDPALAVEADPLPVMLEPAVATWNLKDVGRAEDGVAKSESGAPAASDILQPPPVAPSAPGEPDGAIAPSPPAIQRTLAELVADYSAAETVDADHECLAGAVYFEARGEPVEGQLAVAEVVLNRAASGRYPADVCAVVKQPRQFSFVRNGRFPRINKASEAWRRAVAIAHIAREELAGEIAPDVLWYHADYVSPRWGRRLTRVTRIGSHIFYS